MLAGKMYAIWHKSIIIKLLLSIHSKGERFIFTESQVSILVTPCRREECPCVVIEINATTSPQVSTVCFICLLVYVVVHIIQSCIYHDFKYACLCLAHLSPVHKKNYMLALMFCTSSLFLRASDVRLATPTIW